MNKQFLCILMLIAMISFIGCENSKTSQSKNSNSKSSTSSISSSSVQISDDIKATEPASFTLSDSSSYFCPFVFNGNDLIFPNPDENNRISTISSPLPKDILQSQNVTDFINFSADNIALIGKTLYFSNGAENNALYSYDIGDKKNTKLNTHSVHNLIIVNTDLFYINKSDRNKIYKYDTTTSNSMLICSDSVGSYIISGEFIIYQNLSDNSKLYSIKIDGSSRQKLADYTANSFVVYKGQLLFFNSSDNNNLYAYDPSTLSCKRLNIMNGDQLKILNNSLYFINGDDLNNLYSLSVDLTNSTAKYKPEISEGINGYYLTPAGIFYIPSNNTNNVYYKKAINHS